MTPRSFVYLAVAAALSVLFAIVSFASNNQWSTGKAAGDKLFPALVSEASQIAIIEVQQGGDSVVLERKGGTWTVKSRDGYPADPARVRALLVGLAEADLIESKTRRVDRYSVLELEDPAEKGTKARLVRLLGAKGNVMGEVVIGKKRQEVLSVGKGGTYVRRPGNPQTWLANTELDAPILAKEWVRSSVLTMDTSKISRVTIEMPGEAPLRIERDVPLAPAKDKDAKDEPAAVAPPPGKLQFVGFPPDGKKLKDAPAAEILARSLSSIDMEEFRKLDAPLSGAGVSTVKVEAADGPTTTLRLRKDGDAYWLSVTASGEGDEAKKAAAEITQRTQGWEFKIATTKAEAILRKRADLLEAGGS
jgi:Domain of unknown function (DUF4340)